MSGSVTIVDYGSGNLFSVQRAFEHCGATAVMAQTAEQIEAADRLVLPGVGAFGEGMTSLREHGLVDAIRLHAQRGKPLLGICLGMQMLATGSEEFGSHEGLDVIQGRVIPVPAHDVDGSPLKIPHIGWANLEPPPGRGWDATLLDRTPLNTAVYLVHSFHFRPSTDTHRIAVCHYGSHAITAAVQAGRVVGCQFHPEKSGPAGLRLIARFLAL